MKKILLICGILSSLLYIGFDIFASLQWESYSYVDQAFSELTAIEAPTRSLMVANAIPYNLLLLAFTLGVWLSANGKRSLRIVSIFLLINIISGFIGGVIFPMHSRGTQPEMTFTDTMHIISTAVEVIAMFITIGFAAKSFGNRFRIYSIITIILLLLGGIFAGLYGSQMSEGLPTPWMGIIERVNIYGFMVWVIIFAIMLLRQKNYRKLIHTS